MAIERLEVKIQTSAELAAMKQGVDALGDLREKARAAGLDTSALDTELAQANKEFSKRFVHEYADGLRKLIQEAKAAGQSTGHLERQLQALEKTKPLGVRGRIGRVVGEAVNEIPGVGRVTRAFNGAGGAIGATVAALGLAAEGIRRSVKEFAAAEEQYAKLDAALAQTGLLTDGYREQLNNLAGELQKTTGVADDEWLGVLKVLTQFGSRPESIGMDVEAVKNLAGLLGGDLNTAAMLVGRAVQGNFELFTRYGITLDENASKTEKLQQLYETLARRGGGQLEAANRTQLGQWRQLKNALSDLGEAIGSRISQVGIFQGAMERITFAAGRWAEKIGIIPPKLAGLKNATEATILPSDEAAAAAAGHAHALGEVEESAKAAAEKLDGARKAAEALRAFQDREADLEMARELELLKARQDLTPVQKITAAHDIRERFRKQQVDRERGAIEEEIKRQQGIAEDAGAKRTQALAAAEQQRVRMDAIDEMLGSEREFKERQEVAENAEAAYQAKLAEIRREARYNDPAGRIPGLKLEVLSLGVDAGQRREEADAARHGFLTAVQKVNDLGGFDRSQLAAERQKRQQLLEAAHQANQEATKAILAAVEVITAKHAELSQLDHLSRGQGEVSHLKATLERQEAQSEAIRKPLPEGTVVSDQAAAVNRAVAELNARNEAGLVQAAKALSAGNLGVFQRVITLIELQQRQLDQMSGQLKIVESRANAGRTNF
jgi:hypothetical protein